MRYASILFGYVFGFVFILGCNPPEIKHQKQFYKNFNYITLQPIGAVYDTLMQLPYLKVDTILGKILHLERVDGLFSKEYFYEKYGKGWLRTDSCCEAKNYQFDLYDGSKMISYRYRHNPYKDADFSLITVVQTQANYESDTYFLGWNRNKSYPDFDLKTDTTNYYARLQDRYFLKKDTIWQTSYEYDSKTEQTKIDTFCFVRNVPFEFFYHTHSEPYFKQIIK